MPRGAVPEIGLPLPKAARAEISRRKLTQYTLDPTHPRGRHKARVFSSALAIRQNDWRYLRDQLLSALPLAPVTHKRTSTWEVVIEVFGLNGKVREVITAWEMRGGVPHFVMARVSTRRR